MRDALQGVEPGQVSGIIQVPAGYAIVKVLPEAEVPQRNANSTPLKWWEQSAFGSKASKDTVYRTYVNVKRLGDFQFPVDVVVKFDDGSSVTDHWDGQDRWKTFTYDRAAKVVSAEIDPGTQVMLDRDRFNNSYTVEGDARAEHKMRNIFVYASEWFSQLMSWLT